MEGMTGQPTAHTFGRCIDTPATGNWADSPVLYLLTCYDVWSATPPRGCEPANTDEADSPEEPDAAA